MRSSVTATCCISISLIFSAPALAQQAPPPDDESSIVVTGEEWVEQRERIEDQSKALIRPVRTRKPIPRYFDPLCVETWNISSPFADLIKKRIRTNAEEAGLRLARDGCRANAFIAIVKDVENDFERLKDEHIHVFGDLKRYQLARAERGGNEVRSWNVVESRGRDGTPFQALEIDNQGGGIGGGGRTAALNTQTSGGRLNDTIRRDMIFSVVLFDLDELDGISFAQLADFATMRLLAQTYEVDEENPAEFSTILSLFTDLEQTPPELSRFDKALLRGLYSLPPAARDIAVYEATSSAYRQLLAEELETKSPDG